jgi:hypothetical protein
MINIKKKIFNKILLIFFIISNNVSNSQTLRINEFSNGPSGSKEWIELLVIPTSPTAASLRGCFTNSINVAGWIIDDNDGTFSPTNNNFGSGFATGHLRFKNVAPWTRLPVGALIVIYNDLDKDPLLPADDPYDFNNDCVYVLPATHLSIEYCTTAPIALSCSTKLSYEDCTIYGVGNWNTINASNSGDGMQIRDNSFNLVHGIVYGRTTSSSCGGTANMVGNSLSPLIATTNGSNTFYAYNGLDLPGYADLSKWTTGLSTNATPGNFNNINNEIWIKETIRKGCICDVTLDYNDTKYIIPDYISGFKYKQFGDVLVFQTDYNAKIIIRLFQFDGRVFKIDYSYFKGTFTYKLPKGVYFLNLSIEYRYSQKNLTIKIINP